MNSLPQLPPKIGSHYRAPWRRGDPQSIYIHASLASLYGNHRASDKQNAIARERYHRAKNAFDLDAAVEIVNELWRDEVIDGIVDRIIAADKPCLIVSPHPEFDAGAGDVIIGAQPTNALPFAFASSLAEELGCGVDSEIIEIARPGRTKLNTFERFLWQPRFSGSVYTDHAYIIVDDVCAICGTFAALRSHIVENGGTVAGVSALAQGNGCHVQFPIADATVAVLRKAYGLEIGEFWRQEIGHDITCLTEAEGQRLAVWQRQECRDAGAGLGSLQCLRNRVTEAAEGGRKHARA